MEQFVKKVANGVDDIMRSGRGGWWRGGGGLYNAAVDESIAFWDKV